VTLSASPQARVRAAARWRSAADRVRTVSPQALGRGLIALAVISAALALSVVSWPALLPFVVGAVIAYAVLPIANRLDRYMPRVLAAILAELVAVAILAGVVIVVVPPLFNGLVRVAQLLPSPDQVQAWLARLQADLGELPEPARSILLAVATETSQNLGQALSDLVAGAGAFVTEQLLGILGTVTFVIGLLVIPAWILTLVADERSLKQRGISLLAPAVRADVVAVFRILDRALGTFLRVRVLLAIVAAFLIWLGLTLAAELGIAPFPYAVAAAVLLGSLLLIPELGFLLGFFPILLILAIAGPVPALTLAVVYFGANRIASALVETRISRGVLDVHPGLLIPAIVVLSGFGTPWLLAAAPVVAIIRDLVRYLAGRLADPASPAGVLPGEPGSGRGAAAAPAAVLPSVYRDRPGPRPSTPATRSSQP
jgi:predicted PurR-regulated permease PerM